MPSLALEVQRGGIPGQPGATLSSVKLIWSSQPVSSLSMLLHLYRRLGDNPERFRKVLVASLEKLFRSDPSHWYQRNSLQLARFSSLTFTGLGHQTKGPDQQRASEIYFGSTARKRC